MDRRSVGAMFLVVAVSSSCGPNIPHGWVRPGMPRATGDQDMAACELEAWRVIPDAPRQRQEQQVTTYQGSIGNQQVSGTATTRPQVQSSGVEDTVAKLNAVRERGNYADTCMRAKGYRWGRLD